MTNEAVKVAVESGTEALANVAAKNPDAVKDALIVLGVVTVTAAVIGGTVYYVKKKKAAKTPEVVTVSGKIAETTATQATEETPESKN